LVFSHSFLERFATLFPCSYFQFLESLALTIFAEKEFSRIFTDVNQYSYAFIDRIRERNWYTLVNDNTNLDLFYCLEPVKRFYMGMDASTIDLDLNQFVVHFDSGDLLVILDTKVEVTQIAGLP